MSSAHARQFPQPADLQTGNPNSNVVTLQPSERLLTPQEVADRLGVSQRWVRDHATRRWPKITAVKLGSLLRFRWRDVEDFLTHNTLQGSSKNRSVVYEQ